MMWWIVWLLTVIYATILCKPKPKKETSEAAPKPSKELASASKEVSKSAEPVKEEKKEEAKEEEKKDEEKKDEEKKDEEKKDEEKKEGEGEEKKDEGGLASNKDSKKDGSKKPNTSKESTSRIRLKSKEVNFDKRITIFPKFMGFEEKAISQTLTITNTNTKGKLAIKMKTSDNVIFVVTPPFANIEGGKTAKFKIDRKAGEVKEDKVVICVADNDAGEDPKTFFKKDPKGMNTVEIPMGPVGEVKLRSKDEDKRVEVIPRAIGWEWDDKARNQTVTVKNTKTTGKIAIKMRISDNDLFYVTPVMKQIEPGKSATFKIDRKPAVYRNDKLVVAILDMDTGTDVAAHFKANEKNEAIVEVPMLSKEGAEKWLKENKSVAK